MLTVTGLVRRDEHGLVVDAVWYSSEQKIDRPVTMSWSVKENYKLAKRLEAALTAQVVHHGASINTDINGKTYVAAMYNVMGRRLNADLKRLGY